MIQFVNLSLSYFQLKSRCVRKQLSTEVSCSLLELSWRRWWEEIPLVFRFNASVFLSSGLWTSTECWVCWAAHWIIPLPVLTRSSVVCFHFWHKRIRTDHQWVCFRSEVPKLFFRGPTFQMIQFFFVFLFWIFLFSSFKWHLIDLNPF